MVQRLKPGALPTGERKNPLAGLCQHTPIHQSPGNNLQIKIPAPKQEQGFGVYGAFLCTGTMDLDAKIAFWSHEAVKTSL